MKNQQTSTVKDPIPARAGVGFKFEHFPAIAEQRPDIGWFEVHAENYMEAGGAPHRYLSEIGSRYPLSVHGVGLSIGSDGPLDREHLLRLKAVCDRYQPGLVSEHLAWSTHDGRYLNDLLPVPYDRQSLVRVCDHIDEVQETLARRILLENPSTYVQFASSDMLEVEFLRSITRRTGCGLLLDVNNVHVSSTNHAYDPQQYLRDFPIASVEEVHLGGHALDADEIGAPLLIDSHSCPVIDPVWQLYRLAIDLCGPKPTLIEWDNDIPAWSILLEEARRAEAVMMAGVRRHAEAR